MTDISELIEWFRLYPFVRYALIAGVLIALCSSLIGVTLVLKRFSFIGDGLSHVAFGAMAIAATMQAMVKGSLSFLEPFAEFVNKNNMVIILPITVIAAIILLAGSKN